MLERLQSVTSDFVYNTLNLVLFWPSAYVECPALKLIPLRSILNDPEVRIRSTCAQLEAYETTRSK